MPFAFFRIPTHQPDEPQRQLNQFLAGNRIVQIEKSFHADGESGFWSFCVEWIDDGKSNDQGRSGRVDYKGVLSRAQFAVYAELRELRKELGQRDGVPLYAIATNEQLAEIVSTPILTLAGLKKLDGFGSSKRGKYASALLDVIHQHTSVLQGSGATVTDDNAEAVAAAPDKGQGDAHASED